jgi:hypothetical protein
VPLSCKVQGMHSKPFGSRVNELLPRVRTLGLHVWSLGEHLVCDSYASPVRVVVDEE